MKRKEEEEKGEGEGEERKKEKLIEKCKPAAELNGGKLKLTVYIF